MSQANKVYPLIVVCGNRGDGKTTWVARHMKRELALRKNYTRGFANIHYRNSPEITFTNYAGIRCINDSNEEGVPRTLVHLDQIHKYFDGRRAGSRENLDFWDTLVESRQHGFDVVCTTWAYSSIDPRLRKFANLIVSAKKAWDGFHYDYLDTDLGKFISPPDGFVLSLQKAAEWWQFFKTGELVKDQTLSKVAAVPKTEREALAKKLAVYEPCGKVIVPSIQSKRR